MKESYLFLAEGFEEIEALTAVDVLRRAGIPVKTVSITAALQVTGAHGITVNADLLFSNTLFRDVEWLILPGGLPGAANLYEYAPLQGVLRQQMENTEGRIAAICASPAVVLGRMGLLKGRKATCYPGFEKELAGAVVTNEAVTVDDKFVLGNGPSTALKWALTIVEQTLGEKAATDVAAGMLLYNAPKGNTYNFG